MSKDRFDIKERDGLSFVTDAVVIVDKETGVNYLYVCRGYASEIRMIGCLPTTLS